MTASAPVHVDPEGEADENSIPKSRVDVMIGKATASADARADAAEARANQETERRKDLESRNQPPAPPPSTPEKPLLSREEMQAGVDAGTITQVQMDAELERQLEARVEERVEEKRSVKERGTKIGDQIDEYTARVPDINDTSSDNHRRVRDEFAALRKLEYPNDRSTELMALRAVFGDLSKVKIPEESPSERPVDTTTHSGSSVEEVEVEGAGGDGPGPLKGLEPHFVEYYTEGIKGGRYSGWDDPHLVACQKREIARK